MPEPRKGSEQGSTHRTGAGDAGGEVKELDLLKTPLEGTNLIEASAGTGKTYAITGLVLRLILESGVPIQQILVVTFTEAATSELKDRIRKRLREAADAFSENRTADPFLQGLLARHLDEASRESALRRLNCALGDFDQAAIFTIHGFCLRTLQDHAFASGMLFDAELVSDQESLVREIVQDFWRAHFYAASPLFYAYARASGMSPGKLRDLVGKNLFNPHLKVIPERAAACSEALEKRFIEKFEMVSRSWTSSRDAVEAILMGSPALNRSRYRIAGIPSWLREMDLQFQGECLSCSLCMSFVKFTRSSIEQSVKKNQEPPYHGFFDQAEELQEAAQELQAAYDGRIVGLQVAFIDHLRTRLEARKASKNILFFDDLLVKLERALAEPGGGHLAEIARERFKAALIDEFQDTDSIQYSIFRHIFGDGSSPLFLIGDPKQAIYGFRGADVFSYMDAARQTSRRYTLSENWRSEPSLISGVNAVFDQDHPAFVYEEIAFHPAHAAKAKQHDLLQVDGRSPSPLQVWLLESTHFSDGKPIPKGKAQPLILDAAAAEISRLVGLGRGQRALIGARPVREGDIAVLVRTNREASEVRKSLAILNIHSVLYSTENLFDTHEAMEMERLLTAIANPGREGLIRAALATDLLGVSGEEIGRLMEDEVGWERRLLTFTEYHEAWSRFGFFRMFRQLLSEEEILPRLMMFENGERRCTNVLHLSEVLHQVATENGFNMSALLKWFSSRKDKGTPRLEEHQLRLESDENAVRIVTIHKSKGLEYPVVICPFLWQDSRPGKGPFVFHDERHGMRLTLDLGSPDEAEHRVLAGKEALAENLRLLYVAMTRAMNRCTIVWGPFNGAGTSAPAYLLHPSVGREWDGDLDSLDKRFKGLDDAAVRADLETLRERAGQAVEIREMPLEKGRVQPPAACQTLELSSRPFTAGIDRVWGISSFSSLISKQPHRAELADRDEWAPEALSAQDVPAQDWEQKQHSDIFAFPKGTASGILLHKIFEELDFTHADPEIVRDLVLKGLGTQGLDPAWTDVLCRMIGNVLGIGLPSEFGTFRLSQIPAARRLTELEFTFPLRRLRGSELAELFSRHVGDGSWACGHRDRFRFDTVEGFMKGFIDLVFEANGRFYILDWKSNFLGARIEDYEQEALRKAVRESLYDLQYTLYTAALHQYLKTRLPGYRYESHFGEVFYLFLRGIDPAYGPKYGVYRDRPSGESIETLSEALTGRRQAEVSLTDGVERAL
jgi:exodeoxyribonuclease V beta subunit